MITQDKTATTAVNSTAGTTASPSIPASLTTSHYMVLAVAVAANVTASIARPTGWTSIGTPVAGGTTITLALYGKFWAAGDGAPSVTWTGSSKNASCIVPFVGVDLNTPLDITVPGYSNNLGAASTSPTSPSAQAATNGACRLHISARAGTGSSTPDTRMVEAVDITSTSTSPAALAFDYLAGLSQYSSGNRSDTVTSAVSVAATVWLRPAVPQQMPLLRSARGTSGGSLVPSVTASLLATDVASPPASTLMVACVSIFSGGGTNLCTGVSYSSGGVTLTELQHALDTLNNCEVSIWQKANAATAGGAVSVVAARGGSDSMELWVGEFLNADPRTPQDVGTTNATASSASSQAITSPAPQNATELAVVAQTEDTGTGGTIKGDGTYIWLYQATSGASGHVPLCVQGKEVATGGTAQSWSVTLAGAGEAVAAIETFILALLGPKPAVLSQAVTRASVW